jgi:ferritin-like metal-binding protein YciE
MLSNPRDLFLQLLAEQLWLERMLAFEVLPQLAREAQSESLAHAFEEHLEQTRGHATRVEEVFRAVSGESSSSLDPAAKRLFEHHDELAQKIVEPLLRDVFHAAAAAKTEHYELAGYETLIELGNALGVDVGPLEQNRDEDAQALEQVESIGARLGREAGS